MIKQNKEQNWAREPYSTFAEEKTFQGFIIK